MVQSKPFLPAFLRDDASTRHDFIIVANFSVYPTVHFDASVVLAFDGVFKASD